MSLTEYAAPEQEAERPRSDKPLPPARRGPDDDDQYDTERKILTREERRDMSPEEQHQLLIRWADLTAVPNIAEELETQELDEIGMKVLDETQIDDQSRDEWMEQSEDALDFAMQVVKSRNGPWPGSANVNFPLMAIAANEFNARAYPAVVADRNVVKGVVFGDDSGVPAVDEAGQPVAGPDGKPQWTQAPGALRERADRIGNHMSYQKLEEQPEWESDTDKLLVVLPIIGSAFRKTLFDPAEQRNTSALIYPKNLIINYWAKSIYTAPRITEVLELYPHEVEENIRAGIFCEHDYGPADGMTSDPDAPYVFYEQHRRLDLDQDGYTEPYIVTVQKDTGKVARIAARFDADGVLVNKKGVVQKIVPVDYYTPYEFFPNPTGGVYGVGFGQLLGPLNDQINSSLNQMFDAGALANNGGGFLGKGLSMHSGSVKFKLGEWKLVNALGSTVRESVVPLTFPGPSAAMFQLLSFLVDAARQVALLKDVLTGENMAANTPATTILAMIEQGLKVFTAVFKRVHRSLKQEYDKDYRLNTIYLETESRYRVGNETRMIERDDYLKGSGIEPISDPKTVSDMQKLGKAELLRQSVGNPVVNQIVLHKRIFEAAGIDKIDELVVEEQPPDPTILIKTAELEIKKMAERARALANMALAYKTLAEGDVAAAQIGQAGLDFVAKQLEIIQQHMELMDGDQDGAAGAAPGGMGGNGGPVPRMAAPSGNGAAPPIPAGALGGVGPGSPSPMVAGNA